VFRFPKDEACRIAVTTVEEVLDENPDAFDKVVFNVFSDEQLAIYEDFIKNRG
jgi:O-acetyl-ADP-ribose deacetylase (regulator of RNase III)